MKKREDGARRVQNRASLGLPNEASIGTTLPA